MVRALVDFMYRAHAGSLTDLDLTAMESDLRTFHELKELLIVKGVYDSEARFNKIPKLHMLRHWVRSIRELGTPDGYNTEAPEHLHIEYAKVPWRASNKVRPMQQMVTYIQRQDAIRKHRGYLDRYLGVDEGEGETSEGNVYAGEDDELEEVKEIITENGGDVEPVENAAAGGEHNEQSRSEGEPIAYPNPMRRVAKHPTREKVPIEGLITKYGASNLIRDTSRFLTRQLRVDKHSVLISPRNYVNVWHKLYLYHSRPSFAPFDPVRRDVVRASPPVLGPSNQVKKAGVWDVVLFSEKPNRLRSSRDIYEKHGLERYRAGRVRAIFTLPDHIRIYYPGQLAYVEAFKPFDVSVSPFSRLHSTTPEYEARGVRQTLVIPVTDIAFAAHLVPKFHLLEKELKLDRYIDLLDIGRNFWLNHYYNHHFYQFIQHWRRRRPGLRERLIYNVQQTQQSTSGEPE